MWVRVYDPTGRAKLGSSGQCSRTIVAIGPTLVHEDLRPRIPIPLLPTVTKLPFPTADTHGMDGRNIEPRTVLWAVAEVSWEDQGGTSNRTSATLEDTSPSGACIRLKAPSL